MKSDTKKYYKIPQKMLEIFLARGYQELRVEDQSLFDPYYDSMNDHWSANTSFFEFDWMEGFLSHLLQNSRRAFNQYYIFEYRRVSGSCSVCRKLYGGKDKESYADPEGRFCGI